MGRGGGSGRVEQQQRWDDQLAAQLGGENELSQTNLIVRGGLMGVVSRVQSNISRAFHANREKYLLQNVRN